MCKIKSVDWKYELFMSHLCFCGFLSFPWEIQQQKHQDNVYGGFGQKDHALTHSYSHTYKWFLQKEKFFTIIKPFCNSLAL